MPFASERKAKLYSPWLASDSDLLSPWRSSCVPQVGENEQVSYQEEVQSAECFGFFPKFQPRGECVLLENIL